MKNIIRILVICISLLLVTSCKKEEINEFRKIYDVDVDLVKTISYEEFLNFTEKSTGVVFIGDEQPATKLLAKTFCDVLCSCDVNKAYYVKSTSIKDDKLLDILGVSSLEFPIIIAFKNGELVSYYDNKTETDDLEKYIDDLIHEAYPAVCTEVC